MYSLRALNDGNTVVYPLTLNQYNRTENECEYQASAELAHIAQLLPHLELTAVNALLMKKPSETFSLFSTLNSARRETL